MKKIKEVKQHLQKNKYTWLVTGAAGFIGSNLVEELLRSGQKVIGLDNFSTGFESNIKQVIKFSKNKDFKMIEGDICELKTCIKVCEGVDFVLHQAALGSVPRSIKDPINTNNSNITGYLNMLIASKDTSVQRFIYAGSSSTYGDSIDLPKIESKIGKPLSPYAVTKFTNELYAEIFNKLYDLEIIGLRYFNIFGRRQSPNGSYAAVIPKWILAILNQEMVEINGDGTTSRDFCYIDNAIQANLIAAFADSKSISGQSFNIALNDETNLNDLYKMIVNNIQLKRSSLTIHDPIYKEFRPGDVKHSRADISKAEKLLGYSPTHKVEEGIDETVSWYITNLKI